MKKLKCNQWLINMSLKKMTNIIFSSEKRQKSGENAAYLSAKMLYVWKSINNDGGGIHRNGGSKYLLWSEKPFLLLMCSLSDIEESCRQLSDIGNVKAAYDRKKPIRQPVSLRRNENIMVVMVINQIMKMVSQWKWNESVKA